MYLIIQKRRRLYKFIETESRTVVARAWGQGEMVSCLFNGYRVSVLQDKKFSRFVAKQRKCNTTNFKTFKSG